MGPLGLTDQEMKEEAEPAHPLEKLDQSQTNIRLRMHLPLLPKGISSLSARWQKKPGVAAPFFMHG